MVCFLTSSEQYVSYIDCFLMPMNSMSAVLIVFYCQWAVCQLYWLFFNVNEQYFSSMDCFLTSSEQYVSYIDCLLMPLNSMSTVLIVFYCQWTVCQLYWLFFIANEQYVSYTDCFLMSMSSISALWIVF